MYSVDIYNRVRRACLKDGMSAREAARHFNKDRKTIAKMLRHALPPGYRRSEPPRRPTLDDYVGIIDEILRSDKALIKKQRHTAKRIFERLRDEHIYADKRNGGDLHTHLRCQKQRRKRYGSTERRGQIKNRVSIEKRPAVVDLRSRIGDWEADTVIGKQGHSVLVTLVERKTRFTVAIKAVNKTARAVTDAICDYLKPYQERVLTLTYDNGREFAYHEEIARELTAEGFFAHPYHSWERGLNENTNGLIRQYIPKGKDIDDLSDEDVAEIIEKINKRPRKCLGFKTPNQLFIGLNQHVALAS